MRPINNIVDITELRHARNRSARCTRSTFRKVKDQTIVVRKAKPGETLKTLDGKDHVLDESMLVIADAENATGLAGIMGGEESEIVGDTASVLFESAAFERANNRITARKLGVRTEASPADSKRASIPTAAATRWSARVCW